jgi:hypothetical protein
VCFRPAALHPRILSILSIVSVENRPEAGTKIMWIFLSTLQIGLLLSLFACGPGVSDDPHAATVNLSLVIPATEAHQQKPGTSWWAKVSQWLPSVGDAWAQVSEIAQLRVEAFAPDGASVATETVPVPGLAPGQIIPVSIRVPAGPNRRITVSAMNAAGIKLYSGRTVTDLTPGVTASAEIRLAPTFVITTRINPEGSGTVTSSPPGLACKAICSAGFDADTRVALSASGDANWSFVQWGGACSGRGACTVSNTATVSAQFDDVTTSVLTVNVSGGGRVRINPGGIECAADCTTMIATQTTAELTAVPQTGATFAGWSGACSGSASSCTVRMDTDKTVSASFTTTRRLSVTKTGPLAASGVVSSMPAGINCGTDCSETVTAGSAVTLTASPNAGVLFTGWSGGGCSGTGPCTVTMTEDRNITANFDVAPGYVVISVTKTGTGTGTVTSNPAGINCGDICAASVRPSLSVLTLTATPAVGSLFTGWSGVATCGTSVPTCVLLPLGNQTVSAQFSRVQED